MMKVVNETSEGETSCKVTGLFFKSVADDCGAIVRKFVNNRRESVLCPSPSKLAKKKDSAMVQERILRVILTRCDVCRECSFNRKQSGGSQVEKENFVFPTTATKVESEFSSTKVVESDNTVTSVRSVNINDRQGNTSICLNLQADLEQTDCLQPNFCIITEKNEEEGGFLASDSHTDVQIKTEQVDEEEGLTISNSETEKVDEEDGLATSDLQAELCVQTEKDEEKKGPTTVDSQTNVWIKTEKVDEEEELIISDSQTDACIRTKEDEEEEELITSGSLTDVRIKTEKVDEEEAFIMSDSQTDSFIQTGLSIKTEKVKEEEGLVTIELVGCLVTSDSLKTEADHHEGTMTETVDDLQGNICDSSIEPTDFLPFSFPQSNKYVKTEDGEKRKAPVTMKSLDYTITDDSFVTAVDSREEMMVETASDLQSEVSCPLNKVTKREQFDVSQTNELIQVEEKEEEKVPITSEPTDRLFETTIDNCEEMVVEDDLQIGVSCSLKKPAKRKNSQTKKFSETRKGTKEEDLITIALVSYLPASLKDGEVVSKRPLKFVNCERKEVTADSGPLSSSDPLAIVCNSECPKESTSQKSVEVEREHSVLSQIGSESNSCEKLYACSICPYKSKREVCLRIHSRIHSGSKPYVCTYCAASFTHEDSLTDHLKVHNSSESFVQKLCSTNVHMNSR